MNNKDYLYTWRQFGKDIEVLVKKIKEKGWAFTNIYGPPRGGLVPAVCLSHRLGNVPLIYDPKEITSGTLIVDDIADTGKTLFPYSSGNKIVTLFYHRQSSFVPEIWLREKKKKYILFPWEK